MTPRADFLAILTRNRRRMDAERRELARRVDAIVRTETRGQDVFDAAAYFRVMNALEPVFDAWYGRFPGDTRARFWWLIVDECRAARAVTFRRSVALLRERVRPVPGLMAAIEREAG